MNGNNETLPPFILSATITSIVRQMFGIPRTHSVPTISSLTETEPLANPELEISSVGIFVRETSLATLPVEISFAIFDFLGHSDILSLALTSPYYLNLFVIYFKHKNTIDLLRGRHEDLDILRMVSINTRAVQPAMIRFLCSSWEHAASVKIVEPIPNASRLPQWWSGAPTPSLPGDDAPKGYDTAHEEDIRSIMWFLAVDKLGIEGGIEVCFRCRKWMRICGYDGRVSTRMKAIRTRPL